MKLVECVPNFSEGRDKSILDAIAQEIKSIEAVSLLDVDPGSDTNRTVFTFVGTPEGIEEAAFVAIKKASEIIDMREQKGSHPRMGATDVCPFVPVNDVTMDDCIEIANKVGKRVGEELGIPIYLYEYAATKPEWKTLANIRKGEYEALPKKMKDPDFKPNYGPAEFNAKAGATAVGAREFLIAYNINLNTKDKKIAKDIALDLKRKGRFKRDENGIRLKDEDGNYLREEKGFKNCKAIGWYVDEFGCAQISINLTNYKVTNLYQVFDKASELAIEKGYRVTGSEVVGLVPKDAIIKTGLHYLKKQKKVDYKYQLIDEQYKGIPEREIVNIAVKTLGLNDVTEFDADEKIIEYRIKRDSTKNYLVDLTVEDFAHELSSDSQAPGGGSVAALSGSLSAALVAMVATLSYNLKHTKDKSILQELDKIGTEAQELKRKYLDLIDKDTDAFNKYMASRKKGKEAREKAAQEMTNVPFQTLKFTEDLVKIADRISEIGNQNAVSDAAVAAINANAAAKGGFMNVKINLDAIQDEDFKQNILKKSEEILARVDKKALEIERRVTAKL